MRPTSILCTGILLTAMFVTPGCSSHTTAPASDPTISAKELFDHIAHDHHLPSANAQGAAKEKLLSQAAAGYESLLQKYPGSVPWAAQSLRSLGNIRVEQGRLDDAVKIYTSVGTMYPKADWEVLQSWKSAADLLWDANRQTEATQFYQKIVTRFDTPSASAVIKTIVHASQNRLGKN